LYKVRFSKWFRGRNPVLASAATEPERKSLDLDFVTWDTNVGPYFSLIDVGRPSTRTCW
jgi:hypothetical protein